MGLHDITMIKHIKIRSCCRDKHIVILGYVVLIVQSRAYSDRIRNKSEVTQLTPDLRILWKSYFIQRNA